MLVVGWREGDRTHQHRCYRVCEPTKEARNDPASVSFLTSPCIHKNPLTGREALDKAREIDSSAA
jgi:hypothetical protein